LVGNITQRCSEDADRCPWQCKEGHVGTACGRCSGMAKPHPHIKGVMKRGMPYHMVMHKAALSREKVFTC
jgi:hypothetical protein